MAVPIRTRARRGAHTPRGRETRAAILKAARQMCRDTWLDQLSLAELARAAGTTRASVLFQFPEGWPDIAAELLIEQLEAARGAIDALAKARLKPEERLRQSLRYFVTLAEELGALPPNVRAFSYFWSDPTDAIVSPTRDHILNQIAELLRAVVPGRQSLAEARSATEPLVFFAFDLAAAPIYRHLHAEERVAKLDEAITLTIRGLARK